MDETPDLTTETPAPNVFTPPSIHNDPLLSGSSYTHFSPVPPSLLTDEKIPCVLGVDEAGRGPVLGPMVYGLFYMAASNERSLLTTTYSFDDSKVLTPVVRSNLMETLCNSTSDLHSQCGWAVDVMSAQTISSSMLGRSNYNLNAQAMDSTIALIKGVFARGVNVQEIYIDTIGNPATYQKKLERIFPTAKITVAKKADSLYPCVSAASVCAKVTRDAALERLYEVYEEAGHDEENLGWGSGYPSDARCTNWLKANMEPIFGWGNETRFSWGTVKDLLDAKGGKVEWPVEDEETARMTDFFRGEEEDAGLGSWFGSHVSAEAF